MIGYIGLDAGKFLRIGSIIFLFLCVTIDMSGQTESLSNLRLVKIDPTKGDTLVIKDTLTIIPGSIRILKDGNWEILPDTCVSIKNNQILIYCLASDFDEEVYLQYRTFSFDMGKTYQTAYRPISNPDRQRTRPLELQQLSGGSIFGENTGLDYSGLFNRSLSLGNNQDLYLNSNFNLQLAGQIGDDIEILGAITDNNFPIQPQGNTQQLQDFDRVFIQLTKGRNVLRAGDDEIRNPANSYFSRYFKKIQGVTYSGIWDFGEGEIGTKVGGSVSRGKFNRVFLQTFEGNQGPYKISGADGEPYIVVLAGTERVFWDGVLLKRGESNDYIIDYNQGEITFTTKRIITKDSRISIEYEYSAQYYTRSVIENQISYITDKIEVDFALYSEQDGKTPTELQTLTDEDRFALAQAGDDIKSVFSPGIREVMEGEDPLVAYNRIDTLVDGQVYNVLVPALRDGSEERFTAVFSRVGSGNGNYNISTNVNNGRFYEWVAPDPVTGMMRGEYEPVRVLVAPQLMQMYNLGGKYKFKDGGFLKTEVALSNMDLNRYSLIDNTDNAGLAGNISGQKSIRLSSDSLAWKMSVSGNLEARQEHFRTINPYRNIEFSRDWNFNQLDTGQQVFGNVQIDLQDRKNQYRSSYGYSMFNASDVFNGRKLISAQKFNDGKLDIDARGSYLMTDAAVNSRFFRPIALISYTLEDFQSVKAGFYLEKEQNRLFQRQDSLELGSFDYNLYRFFLELPETSKKFRSRISYDRRYDYSPLAGQFELFTTANDYVWSGLFSTNRASTLQWNLTYRTLEVNNSQINSLGVQEGNKFLGRVNYGVGFFKNMVRSNTIYEINSGQEPRTELTYIRVERGRGTHIWTDYNEDDVQQIGEFDLAPFPDTANFIQFFNRTDELVGTNNIVFNQSLNIIPIQKEDLNFVGDILQRFSLLSQFVLNRKTSALESFNPFVDFQRDTNLLSGNMSNNHILYFNRNDPGYEFQIGFNGVSNRSLLLAGVETRTLNKQYLRYRQNFFSSVSFIIEGSVDNEFSSSELTDARNFNILNYRLSPEISYQSGTKYRSVFKYSYRNSENEQAEDNAVINEFSFQNTLANSNTSNLRMDLTAILIKFEGRENSPVALAMLDGFRNGTNYVLNFVYERKLSNNIRLSIGYEGRKSPDVKFLHTARAQVGAIF